MDNRPLRFEEFEKKVKQVIYVRRRRDLTSWSIARTWSSRLSVRPACSIRSSKCADEGSDRRSARRDPRSDRQGRAGAGDDADEEDVGGFDRLFEGCRHQGAVSAFRYQDAGADGDFARLAAGHVPCAGRHQLAAGRLGFAGSIAGRDFGCGQGRLPALRAFADSDDRPGGA